MNIYIQLINAIFFGTKIPDSIFFSRELSLPNQFVSNICDFGKFILPFDYWICGKFILSKDAMRTSSM